MHFLLPRCLVWHAVLSSTKTRACLKLHWRAQEKMMTLLPRGCSDNWKLRICFPPVSAHPDIVAAVRSPPPATESHTRKLCNLSGSISPGREGRKKNNSIILSAEANSSDKSRLNKDFRENCFKNKTSFYSFSSSIIMTSRRGEYSLLQTCIVYKDELCLELLTEAGQRPQASDLH